MYIHMYPCICVCVYMYVIYTHTCVYIYIYIHTHIHIHLRCDATYHTWCRIRSGPHRLSSRTSHPPHAMDRRRQPGHASQTARKLADDVLCTDNPQAKNLDFRGLDPSRFLTFKRWNFQLHRAPPRTPGSETFGLRTDRAAGRCTRRPGRGCWADALGESLGCGQTGSNTNGAAANK